jgi:hypothetical protein
MSADPVAFVGERLADLPALLEGAQIDADVTAPGDEAALRAAVPEILDTMRRLLDRVHAGELAVVPAAGVTLSMRESWL